MLEKRFGKQIKDERVTASTRRICTEGYWIFFCGLLFIFLYKGVVLDRPIEEWRDEWRLFELVAIYSTVRQVMLGVPLHTGKHGVLALLFYSVLGGGGLWVAVVGIGALTGHLTGALMRFWIVPSAVAAALIFVVLLLYRSLSARRADHLSGADEADSAN